MIGVGGTTLNGCSGTSCAGFTSETAWSDSGGGVSAYETIPAYQSAYDGPVYDEPSGGISALTGGMRGSPTSRSTRIRTPVSRCTTAPHTTASRAGSRSAARASGPRTGRGSWPSVKGAAAPSSAQNIRRRVRVLPEGHHERHERLLRHRLHGRRRLRPRDRAGQSDQLSPIRRSAGRGDPVPPHFYNGNVEGIRNTGSDTTFFMMQKIGDLYTGAGLYGCTLNAAAGRPLYNSGDPASTTSNEEYYCQSGKNISTTDVNDNWDRTEVTEGVDDVGSGAGQNQLCGAVTRRCRSTSPGPSKPVPHRVLDHGRDRLRQGRRAHHRLPA